MFLQLEKHDGAHFAIIDDGGVGVTYAELITFCQRFGMQTGTRKLIFILCENCAGALAGYVAALSTGTVALMLPASLHESMLDKLIQSYHPSYLWAPVTFAKQQNYRTVFSQWDYELIDIGFESPSMAPELALLLTTSGSTGSPKLVRHTLANVEVNARAVAEAFMLTEDARGMVSLPIHFTQGLNVASSHIAVGGTVLLSRATLTEKGFWEFFRTQRAQSFTGVPFSYELLEKLRFFRMDLPDLKILNQGGGRLRDSLFMRCAQYAEDTGKKFIATYGSTETSSRMAYLPPELAMEKTGSVGRPLPGCSLCLVDEDGNEITEPHTQGELIFSGPNVTMGYAESALDLMKGDERGGVYATGDLGYFDEDGCFYIVGRKKRFLKLFGYRLSLDSAERLISSELKIQCACTGTDKVMHVFVEQEGKNDEIIQLLSGMTGVHKQAFWVHVIESIPKGENGKTRYAELEKLM